MHRIAPVAIALAMAAAPLALQPAAAQDGQSGGPRPMIVVEGQGEAAVAPDMALIDLTVLRDADTAAEAMDQANEAMAGVIAAMKEAGVAERDLQTSGLSIQPRYVYPQNGGNEAPRITGYEVRQSLSVRVRDLAALGALIDTSVELGVNQGGSIVFTNDDPADALAEARRDAVADARSRAETLAEAAGVTLGQILRITETSGGEPPRPMPMKAMRMESDAAMPVEAGENSYSVNVTISFGIGQ